MCVSPGKIWVSPGMESVIPTLALYIKKPNLGNALISAQIICDSKNQASQIPGSILKAPVKMWSTHWRTQRHPCRKMAFVPGGKHSTQRWRLNQLAYRPVVSVQDNCNGPTVRYRCCVDLIGSSLPDNPKYSIYW